MTCSRRHTLTGLGATDFGLRIAGNGSEQVIAICPECGTQSSPIAHALIARLGLDRGSLLVVADYRGQIGRCSRRGCDRTDIEEHHFAPKSVFRGEAEQWPTAYLCREHHDEWHRRVGAA